MAASSAASSSSRMPLILVLPFMVLPLGSMRSWCLLHGNWYGTGRAAGEFGPPLARLLRQLVHQRDCIGVVVAGSRLDPAVAQHRVHEVAARLGPHDRERPVVERADAAGRDVGVFGGEVGAMDATLARPGVAFLERDLVVVAVVHPDLKDA